MRIWRLIHVVLLAFSVAVLPISAGTAMADTGNAAMGEMSATAPDDGCASCKSVPSDRCSPPCCQMQALPVEPLIMPMPLPEGFLAPAAESMAASSRRPDPPPPRS